MKFVAPEQAPEQAEIIRNTPFWPDVDLSEFRSVMRTDGTVTQPRLKQVALSAISEVNAELYEFRRRQQMLGYASLAEVPAEQLDGKSERIQHYFNAVYCWHAPCSTNVTRTMTPRHPVRSEARNWRKPAVIYGVTPAGPSAGCRMRRTAQWSLSDESACASV